MQDIIYRSVTIEADAEKTDLLVAFGHTPDEAYALGLEAILYKENKDQAARCKIKAKETRALTSALKARSQAEAARRALAKAEKKPAVVEKHNGPVANFVDECCIENAKRWTPLAILFNAYDVFQHAKGYRAITKRQFAVKLTELGFDKNKGRIEGFHGVYITGLCIQKHGVDYAITLPPI